VFTGEANFVPSIMFGDVCGGKKIDLKTVAPRNVIYRLCGASLLVRVGSPMIVPLPCTPSLKEI